MEIFYTVAVIFTIWMCLDCVQRKEPFVWIVIMVVLCPIGAVAYFFTVKSAGPQKRVKLFSAPQQAKEVETEETLQYKELINLYHKAFHYEKLGQIYLEQKKFDLAISAFESAIEKDPELADARYGLAKCLHAQGDHIKAAEALEELLKIDKKHDYGNAQFGLAECYRLTGQDDKALEAYDTVIKSHRFFKAYHYYARLLDKKGKKEEAVGYMKKIIGFSKDLPEYKLEKERYWIDEAYKYLKNNGVELA
jgi:tetratricopeptide (TPR) repeat protein